MLEEFKVGDEVRGIPGHVMDGLKCEYLELGTVERIKPGSTGYVYVKFSEDPFVNREFHRNWPGMYHYWFRKDYIELVAPVNPDPLKYI
jgi:hypothetical protein